MLLKHLSKVFIVSFVLLLSNKSYCQPPGYLSKRLIITYNNAFMPTRYNHNQNKEKGFTSFNTQNIISLDYVLSRRTTISLNYAFFESMFDFGDSFNYGRDNLPSNYHGRSYFEVIDPMYGDVKVNSIGIGFKYFTKKDLCAPLGRFIGFDLNLVNFKTHFDELLLYEKMDPKDYQPIIKNDGNHYKFAIIFTKGKQKVIFNRFILKQSWQAGLYLSGITGNKIWGGYNNFDYTTMDRLDEDNYIEKAADARLFSHYFINYKIGIGFLAF